MLQLPLCSECHNILGHVCARWGGSSRITLFSTAGDLHSAQPASWLRTVMSTTRNRRRNGGREGFRGSRGSWFASSGHYMQDFLGRQKKTDYWNAGRWQCRHAPVVWLKPSAARDCPSKLDQQGTRHSRSRRRTIRVQTPSTGRQERSRMYRRQRGRYRRYSRRERCTRSVGRSSRPRRLVCS